MPAANTDKLIKGARRFSTTLAATIPNGTVDSMSLVSTTGLPTDTAIALTIDRIDENNNKTPLKEEVVIGVVSGTNVINLIRGVEGTAQGHTSGAVVEARLTANQWNRMVDWGLTEHAQDGTHRIGAAIYDANGNKIIETSATPSAVNNVKITNAATGGEVTVEGSGTDTSVPLFLKGKSASVGVEGVYNNGNITGSVTINMKKGTRQKATLTGNVTLDFSNPVEGQALELFLIQDATGGRTISFTPTINWQDNIVPIWTMAANKVNVIVLRYIGTSYYGIGAKFA